MFQSHLVLLLGQDYRLLQTRQWVLESSGLVVRTATNLIDLERISSQVQVDLFLLCDSLLPDVRSGATALITARWPIAKRLLLAPLVLPFGVEYGSHPISAAEGPGRLLTTIHDLLAEPVLINDTNDPLLRYS